MHQSERAQWTSGVERGGSIAVHCSASLIAHHAGVLHFELALFEQRVAQELVEFVSIRDGLKPAGTAIDGAVGHVNLHSGPHARKKVLSVDARRTALLSRIGSHCAASRPPARLLCCD